MVKELRVCVLLCFLLVLPSVFLSFTVTKKLGHWVLLTSVHKLRMQWPDYLANLLFHSYCFSSNSRPTPPFRPLLQQPGCVACSHPIQSSLLASAISRCPHYLSTVCCWRFTTQYDSCDWAFITVASMRRFWTDRRGCSIIWHTGCDIICVAVARMEDVLVTRNLPAEGIWSQDTWWLPEIRSRYILNPSLQPSAVCCGQEMRHWAVHFRLFEGKFAFFFEGLILLGPFDLWLL
jgi:hypothetical protein